MNVIRHSLCKDLLAAVALVFAAAWALPAGAEAVGAANHVIGAAFGTAPGGHKSQVALRDEVVQEELLETLAKAGLHVEFLDETQLRMGADSILVIDRYVYDPATREGVNSIKLAVGVFRFISGKMAKEGIRIETPSAIIGVRGTDLQISVALTGETVIDVLAGAAIIDAINSTQSAIIGVGIRASINAAGTGVEKSAAESGLIDSALKDADTSDGPPDGRPDPLQTIPVEITQPAMPIINPNLIMPPSPPSHHPSHHHSPY